MDRHEWNTNAKMQKHKTPAKTTAVEGRCTYKNNAQLGYELTGQLLHFSSLIDV